MDLAPPSTFISQVLFNIYQEKNSKLSSVKQNTLQYKANKW